MCCGQSLLAQTQIDTTQVDDKYREDQFYISVTYNLLSQKPKGISQSGFSSGFHFGFIRDMPINKRRNLAIGLGLGLSTNSYNQNLLVQENEDQDVEFTVLEDRGDYTKNKFSTLLLEVPFEFRWRSSTPSTYKFWRMHAGLKVGYVLLNRSKHEGNVFGDFKYSNVDAFNDFQYALTLSAGYSNYNIHINLPLNPIFDDKNAVGNTSVDMRAVKIGLIFYIL